MSVDKARFMKGNTVPINGVEFFNNYNTAMNYRDPTYASGVYQCHKKRLLADWGKQDFCFTTWYRSWIWVRHLPCGGSVWVMASSRGMEFQINPVDVILYGDQFETEFIVWWKDFIATYGYDDGFAKYASS